MSPEKVMSSKFGTPTGLSLEMLIKNHWRIMLLSGVKELTAKSVLELLTGFVEDWGLDVTLPKLRRVQEIVSDIRTSANRTEDSVERLGDDWPKDSEDIAYLLDLERLRKDKMKDRPFTLDEIKIALTLKKAFGWPDSFGRERREWELIDPLVPTENVSDDVSDDIMTIPGELAIITQLALLEHDKYKDKRHFLREEVYQILLEQRWNPETRVTGRNIFTAESTISLTPVWWAKNVDVFIKELETRLSDVLDNVGWLNFQLEIELTEKEADEIRGIREAFASTASSFHALLKHILELDPVIDNILEIGQNAFATIDPDDRWHLAYNDDRMRDLTRRNSTEYTYLSLYCYNAIWVSLRAIQHTIGVGENSQNEQLKTKLLEICMNADEDDVAGQVNDSFTDEDIIAFTGDHCGGLTGALQEGVENSELVGSILEKRNQFLLMESRNNSKREERDKTPCSCWVGKRGFAHASYKCSKCEMIRTIHDSDISEHNSELFLDSNVYRPYINPKDKYINLQTPRIEATHKDKDYVTLHQLSEALLGDKIQDLEK